MIQPIEIIEKYYLPHTKAHHILITHSRLVADKAVAIAHHLQTMQTVDINFVEQAAWLHDIGMFTTHAPELGCYGSLPYLCHGIEGGKILRAEGLPQHAKVCENHIGVGLSAQEIALNNLPLPQQDMKPTSLEQQIIAYADLFFSKNPQRLDQQRSVEQVRRSLCQFGEDKGLVFDRWHALFGAE